MLRVRSCVAPYRLAVRHAGFRLPASGSDVRRFANYFGSPGPTADCVVGAVVRILGIALRIAGGADSADCFARRVVAGFA